LSKQLKDKLGDIAEFIRKIVRAMKGQTAEDDVFSGLINVKDERERTRLSEYDVYGHSAMQIISDWYPEEMGYWKQIATMEDIYFISLEGEQRREAILMQRAKAEIRMAETGVMQVPRVETKPQEEKPKEEKKGLFHR
jgi:hypothetical protein